MNQSLQITLDTVDVFQLLDGLKSKAESWWQTAQFLCKKNIKDGAMNINDSSDPAEARQIYRHYRDIIGNIEKQIAKQMD